MSGLCSSSYMDCEDHIARFDADCAILTPRVHNRTWSQDLRLHEVNLSCTLLASDWFDIGCACVFIEVSAMAFDAHLARVRQAVCCRTTLLSWCGGVQS